jgi:hypothetical protein
VASGIIEIKEYPPERLPLLRKAVFNKKKRVWKGRTTYLEIPVKEREYFSPMEVALKWVGKMLLKASRVIRSY